MFYSKKAKATLDRIKYFQTKKQEGYARRQKLLAPDRLPTSTPDAVAQAHIDQRGIYFENRILFWEWFIQTEIHFDLETGTFTCPIVTPLLVHACANAGEILHMSYAEYRAYRQIVEAPPHHTLAKKFNRAMKAAMDASDAASEQLVFQQMYAITEALSKQHPAYKPTHEIEHDALTGWIASQKERWHVPRVNRQRPANLEAEVLEEMRSSVFQMQPRDLPFFPVAFGEPSFINLPTLVRGSVAKTNQSDEDKWKDHNPATQAKLREMTEPADETEEVRLRIGNRQAFEALRPHARLNRRENEYFTCLLENPELYFNSYGGNLAVSKRLGWTPENVRRVKSDCLAKLTAAAQKHP